MYNPLIISGLYFSVLITPNKENLKISTNYVIINQLNVKYRLIMDATVQAAQVGPRVVGYGRQAHASSPDLGPQVSVSGRGTQFGAGVAIYGRGVQRGAGDEYGERALFARGAAAADAVGRERVLASAADPVDATPLGMRKANVIKGLGAIRLKDVEEQREISTALHDFKQLVIKKVEKDSGRAIADSYETNAYEIDVQLNSGEIRLIRKSDGSEVRIDTERMGLGEPGSLENEIILSLEGIRNMMGHYGHYSGAGYFSGEDEVWEDEPVLGTRMGANGYQVLRRNFTETEKHALSFEDDDEVYADIAQLCGEDEELASMVGDLRGDFLLVIDVKIAALQRSLYGKTQAERDEIEEGIEAKIEKLRDLEMRRELMLIAYTRALEHKLSTEEPELSDEALEDRLLAKVEEYFVSHAKFGAGASEEGVIKYKALSAMIVATALYGKEEDIEEFEAEDYKALRGGEYHFGNKLKYRALLKRRGLETSLRVGPIGSVVCQSSATIADVIQDGSTRRAERRAEAEAVIAAGGQGARASEEEGAAADLLPLLGQEEEESVSIEEALAAGEGHLVGIDPSWFNWHAAYEELDREYDTDAEAQNAFTDWVQEYGGLDAMIAIEAYKQRNSGALGVVDGRMPLLSTSRLHTLKSQDVRSEEENSKIAHTEAVRAALEGPFRAYVIERVEERARQLEAAEIESGDRRDIADMLSRNPAHVHALMKERKAAAEEPAGRGRASSVSSVGSDSSEASFAGMPAAAAAASGRRARAMSTDSDDSDDWLMEQLMGIGGGGALGGAENEDPHAGGSTTVNLATAKRTMSFGRRAIDDLSEAELLRLLAEASNGEVS